MTTPEKLLRWCFILICVSVANLFQGCVPILVSAAISDSRQNDAAYTEYLFDAQAKNKALQQAGNPPQPILTERNWIENVYQPRLEYAQYYTSSLNDRSIALPLAFEVWKETEYPKILAQRAKMREQGHKH